MNAYVLLVATAALTSALCAGGILARDPMGRASRRGALLLLVTYVPAFTLGAGSP